MSSTVVRAPKKTMQRGLELWDVVPANEVCEWFRKSNIESWKFGLDVKRVEDGISIYYIFKFDKEADATLFLLKWG